jgi:hypothetical protein
LIIFVKTGQTLKKKTKKQVPFLRKRALFFIQIQRKSAIPKNTFERSHLKVPDLLQERRKFLGESPV